MNSEAGQRHSIDGHVLRWFRCAKGHLGRIDQEQADGKVSIICTECGWHGYVSEGTLEVEREV